MRTANRLFEWVEANRDIAFDLVRIYLGIGLLVRGALFIADSSALAGLTSTAGTGAFLSSGVAQYVALAHLGGGLLMALGLLTRAAALVQIPVLVGAVFFVHLNEGLLAAGQSLEFSTLVLFLLIVIFLHGSGRLSLDYVLFERERVQAVREAQRSLLRPPRPALATAEVGDGVLGEIDVERPTAPAAPSGPGAPSGCTCEAGRDRDHPRVQAERRYGMRALRFLTGTTGTPKEIVFRCRDCGHVVESSAAEEDIAYYTHH